MHDHLTRDTVPSADDIRRALERVLASDQFANAGRHSRLLRYLVERTLAGEGDQLKEYVLATEVFQRPESYDPRLDSIVRVEIRRLRKRLDDYYSSDGAADDTIISLRPGTYAPVFAARDSQSARAGAANGIADDVLPGMAAGAASAAAVTNPTRHRFARLLVVVAAAALLAFVAFAFRLNVTGSSSAQGSRGPGIAVLPFEHFSTSAEDAALAARVTDALTIELARLGTLSVASRTSATQYSSGSGSVTAIAAALNVDFVLEGTASISDGTMKLQIRLVDARLDRKVWVTEHVVRTAQLADPIRQIAAETGAAALRYRRPD